MEQSRSPSVSPSKQPASAASSTVTLFEQYCAGGNPFEIQADSKDDETEDVLASNGVWNLSRKKKQIVLSVNDDLFCEAMMVKRLGTRICCLQYCAALILKMPESQASCLKFSLFCTESVLFSH